jgi:prepilin-type N-terminal cleavage/methylation domain-containing protein
MSKAARKGEQGFTLVEMVVVVAILAIIAVIATINVSTTLKKQRVEAAANQLQSFIESASVYARERSTGVFVWLHRDVSPGGAGLWWYGYLIADTDGDDILDYVITDPNGQPPGNPAANADTYILTQKVALPEDITLSPNSGPTNVVPALLPNQWPGPNNWPVNPNDNADFLILCDPRALPFDPNGATQIQAPTVISVTHQEMVDGAVNPGMRYDITISPLWHTKSVLVLY